MISETFAKQWPLSIDGLFVQVSGARGVGKTTFAITTGATPDKIAFFDGEASATNYHAQLHFGTYHNLILETISMYGSTPTDEQYYIAVSDMIDSMPDGKYDVLVFDNVLRFESGLVSYVQNNHKQFGISSGQMAGAPALIWGPIKARYEQAIVSWLAKAGMVIVTTPIGEQWVHGKPSGVYRPKGKDVLEWLTGLRIWLQFRRGSKIPSGLVLKDRITKLSVIDGLIQPQSVLPRKINPCTWANIKEYMEHPADTNNPSPDEELTEDEWATLNGSLPKDKLLQLEVARLQLQADARAEIQAKAIAKEDRESTGPQFADTLQSKTPRNVAELIANAFSSLELSLDDIQRISGKNVLTASNGEVAEIWEQLVESKE